jgi:hypothetical protein
MKNISQITRVLVKFYNHKCDNIDVVYKWNINYHKLPDGIKLNEKKSLFHQNLNLKHDLTNRYKKNEKDKKEIKRLIKYYISDWGGIHTNSDETLRSYCEKSPEFIIKNGKKGIASWSKALTVINFRQYAIFDARVSVSLNGLILQHIDEKTEFFPILPSRNKIIKEFNQKLKIKLNKQDFINSDIFYQTYLDIIKIVAKELKVGIAEIEMLLFAYAEEIAKNCVKRK